MKYQEYMIVETIDMCMTQINYVIIIHNYPITRFIKSAPEDKKDKTVNGNCLK